MQQRRARPLFVVRLIGCTRTAWPLALRLQIAPRAAYWRGWVSRKRPRAQPPSGKRKIRSGAIVVEPNVEIAAIDRDPSDKRYLECAVEGGASYVVSGDRHLLDLEGFEGIVILSPAAFVAVLNL